MERDTGRPEEQEASLFSRRQYLLATGALAGTAGAGIGTGTAAAANQLTIDALATTTTNSWSTVPLSNTYSTPVVVAPSLSHNGNNPASPRVRNVTSDSFEVSVDEWRYLDGWHLSETIGCFVTDTGEYSSAEGRKIAVGTMQTNHQWSPVTFSTAFASTPVVFSNEQTRNGHDPVVTRHRNVTESGMEIRLQEEEAEGPHLVEDVGFLAIEPGVGTINDRSYEANRSVEAGATWQTISFDGTYEQPVFLADMQTSDGTNVASVRYRNLTGSSVEVKVQEERSADQEVWHKPERIGYLVIEGGSGSDTTTGYGLGGYGEGGYGQ